MNAQFTKLLARAFLALAGMIALFLLLMARKAATSARQSGSRF
jgi:hypothetical protein